MKRLAVRCLSVALLNCLSLATSYAQSPSATAPGKITCKYGSQYDGVICRDIDHAYLTESQGKIVDAKPDVETTFSLVQAIATKGTDKAPTFEYADTKGNTVDLHTTYFIEADFSNPSWQEAGFGHYRYICNAGCSITNLPY